MGTANLDQTIESVRRFNRFYTQRIGVLDRQYLGSPFSVTEARVIYQLAQRESSTATQLTAELDLDAGYLSRILRNFEKQGLVEKQVSPNDGRQSLIRLSEAGQAAFAQLNGRSHHGIQAMMDYLPAQDQARLVDAMHTIEELMGAPSPQPGLILLRPPQPGDMGWVVHRHGVLYAEEYGWNEEFEALVAEIVAKFTQQHDPRCERCWIAEKDGEIVGSVFLVRLSDTVAKLRLLYVEPKARGLGLGRRLVEECIRFARQRGYQKMTLWTNSVLLAARHIYRQAGFRLIQEEPHHSFGHDLTSETWELDL